MQPRFKLLAYLTLLPLVLSSTSHAALRLPAIFGDHMVLQMGQTIPVWGWAEPDAQVKVVFRHFSEETTADSDGKWLVKIGPLNVGGPDKLIVASAGKTIVLDDVLAGEVWLCSGQSNMAMTVNRCFDAEEEIASADYPKIRQFVVPRTNVREPLDDIRVTRDDKEAGYQRIWQPASQETVGRFTGAGYFFGRNLHKNLGDIPIGLINSSWGGSVAEAWVSAEGLSGNPETAGIVEEWPEYSRHSEGWRRGYKTYLEEAEKAQDEGREHPPYYRQPSVLYNGMIAPILNYGIRGVIWYQGESNVTRPEQYSGLFKTLISDWRGKWGSSLPFIWVQLPNFQADLEIWPYQREAQTKALELANTSMAVTIDVGEQWDIHPRNKQSVGNRLALATRELVYLEDLPGMAPLFKSMEVDGASCRLFFDNQADGLMSSNGQAIRGFTIAGDDQEFVPAEAFIDGEAVVVRSDEITQPVAVRYAWNNYPVDLNLYSTHQQKIWLPATPFRTDNWNTMPEIQLVD